MSCRHNLSTRSGCHILRLTQTDYSRSFEIIKNNFENLVCTSQGILDMPERWEKMLAIIPDEAVKAQVRAEWEDAPGRDPLKKWNALKAIIADAIAHVSGGYSRGTLTRILCM